MMHAPALWLPLGSPMRDINGTALVQKQARKRTQGPWPGLGQLCLFYNLGESLSLPSHWHAIPEPQNRKCWLQEREWEQELDEERFQQQQQQQQQLKQEEQQQQQELQQQQQVEQVQPANNRPARQSPGAHADPTRIASDIGAAGQGGGPATPQASSPWLQLQVPQGQQEQEQEQGQGQEQGQEQEQEQENQQREARSTSPPHRAPQGSQQVATRRFVY